MSHSEPPSDRTPGPVPRPVEKWLGRAVGTAAFVLTPERVEHLRANGIDLAAAVASREALFALGAGAKSETMGRVVSVAWAASGGGENSITVGGRTFSPVEFARLLGTNADLYGRTCEAVFLAVLAAFPDSSAARELGLDPKKWKGKK